MSWSLRPGRIDTLSIRVGFVVKKRSKMCFLPVGEVTVCSRRQSLKTCRHSLQNVGNLQSVVGAKLCQSTNGRLKSPISQIFEEVVLPYLRIYSVHLGYAGRFRGAYNGHQSELTWIRQDSAGPRGFHSLS